MLENINIMFRIVYYLEKCLLEIYLNKTEYIFARLTLFMNRISQKSILLEHFKLNTKSKYGFKIIFFVLIPKFRKNTV